MIEEYEDVIALELYGGPFSDGEEYKMALSRQVDNGREEFWFTVFGSHKGKPIQFDFNSMPREKLEDMRAAIDLILETPNANLTGKQNPGKEVDHV